MFNVFAEKKYSKKKIDSSNLIKIALAGNANVGKSAIFNHLTGLKQHVGNWPGKTIEKSEGTLFHHNKHINIVDLPGIYSFSTYSEEEVVAREYILNERPDVIINVIDASFLERNLFLSLQLLEMGVPVVIALNLVDIAKKKGISVNVSLLQSILNVPIVTTIASKGIGVHELIDKALDYIDRKINYLSKPSIKYGYEIESKISELVSALAKIDIKYPLRWAAIKLLENDEEVVNEVIRKDPEIIALARKVGEEISSLHGEDCSTVIASERYALAARIAREVTTYSKPSISRITDVLDNLSMHPLMGYVMLFTIMFSILVFISFFGGWLTELITNFFSSIKPEISNNFCDILWNGGVVGFYAALSVALGFILPFYIILGLLEDSGYLPRIAFLMDKPCHTIGLHGKASMPLLLALGCNVPACISCTIMETKRDKIIATILTTIVPCSARTAVLLGLVGAFIGWQWAVGLYAFQFAIIFGIGKLLNKFIPGASPGIIMEIPIYRFPSIKMVLKQAWYRFKDFVIVGFPLIILGSLIIETFRVLSIIQVFTTAVAPLTSKWLGLPDFTSVLLIFGVLRKEAALALMTTFAGSSDFLSVMSPLQMIVFSIVILLYIPCISTIAVLIKEVKVKTTIIIVIGEILLALLIGGIVYRFLGLFFN